MLSLSSNDRVIDLSIRAARPEKSPMTNRASEAVGSEETCLFGEMTVKDGKYLQEQIAKNNVPAS